MKMSYNCPICSTSNNRLERAGSHFLKEHEADIITLTNNKDSITKCIESNDYYCPITLKKDDKQLTLYVSFGIKQKEGSCGWENVKRAISAKNKLLDHRDKHINICKKLLEKFPTDTLRVNTKSNTPCIKTEAVIYKKVEPVVMPTYTDMTPEYIEVLEEPWEPEEIVRVAMLPGESIDEWLIRIREAEEEEKEDSDW
jgi:hypothetical protein